MWQSRKKENVSDEDAELRSLANAYSSKLKGITDPVAKTETSSPPKSALNSPPPLTTITSQPSTSPEKVAESSPNDIIQGNSFSYTLTEAKLYANEEPCDTWRHFDVTTPSPLIPAILIHLGVVSSSFTATYGIGLLSIWSS
jgi:hypothetical protein